MKPNNKRIKIPSRSTKKTWFKMIKTALIVKVLKGVYMKKAKKIKIQILELPSMKMLMNSRRLWIYNKIKTIPKKSKSSKDIFSQASNFSK